MRIWWLVSKFLIESGWSEWHQLNIKRSFDEEDGKNVVNFDEVRMIWNLFYLLPVNLNNLVLCRKIDTIGLLKCSKLKRWGESEFSVQMVLRVRWIPVCSWELNFLCKRRCGTYVGTNKLMNRVKMCVRTYVADRNGIWDWSLFLLLLLPSSSFFVFFLLRTDTVRGDPV